MWEWEKSHLIYFNSNTSFLYLISLGFNIISYSFHRHKKCLQYNIKHMCPLLLTNQNSPFLLTVLRVKVTNFAIIFVCLSRTSLTINWQILYQNDPFKSIVHVLARLTYVGLFANIDLVLRFYNGYSLILLTGCIP